MDLSTGFPCMGAPARGPLCAPRLRVDLASQQSQMSHMFIAFPRSQIAIVPACAGLLIPASTRRNAPKATAVAYQLQTRARLL